MKIVICEKCLKRYNMDACVMHSIYGGSCDDDYKNIRCPHCGNITYKHIILSEQKELKKLLKQMEPENA